MSLFEQLSNNKGTVSSALGKALAQKALDGDSSILLECIELASYQAAAPDQRNIRAGAAKVVEIVAEERPEWVAPHLEKLLPALSVDEPQTRWMILHTMGYCAHLNPAAAQKAIASAEKAIAAKEGLIIASAADLFLGDYGALSPENARLVFPILERSLENCIFNEQDWLLEACLKLLPNLEQPGRATVLNFARQWQVSTRKSTQQRASKILRFHPK